MNSNAIQTDESVYPVQSFIGKTLFAEPRKTKNQILIEPQGERENGAHQIGEREARHRDDSIAVESEIEIKSQRKQETGNISKIKSKIPKTVKSLRRKNSESCLRIKARIVR